MVDKTLQKFAARVAEIEGAVFRQRQALTPLRLAPEGVVGAALPADSAAWAEMPVGERWGGYGRTVWLHGEVAVQGKDGVRTIVVQRGTVTAADGKTVSVKSSDGFAQTWTLGDKLRVVQDKKKVAVDAVKTGATIGVAGRKDGDAAVARLIVIG